MPGRMIGQVIWFVAGCWVAGLVLAELKLKKLVMCLGCGGIPFHELSHLAACLALGVRVQSITLLHIDEAGAGGNVKPRDEIRNPFTALVVALAPGIGALFWAMLFAWGITTVYEAGYDEAWAWLLLYLAVGTGMAAAPSGGDLGYAWHVIAKHPGQFLIGLGGSILAIHAALIEGVHSPRRGFERVLVSSLNLLVASSTFSFSAA